MNLLAISVFIYAMSYAECFLTCADNGALSHEAGHVNLDLDLVV